MSANLILWIILALSVAIQIAGAAYSSANTEVLKAVIAAKKDLPSGTMAVAVMATVFGLGTTGLWVWYSAVVHDWRFAAIPLVGTVASFIIRLVTRSK